MAKSKKRLRKSVRTLITVSAALAIVAVFSMLARQFNEIRTNQISGGTEKAKMNQIASPDQIEIPKADLTKYSTYRSDTDYAVYEANASRIKKMTEEKKSFVAYMAYAGCPWCEQALPVLNEECKKAGTYIEYIDVKSGDITKEDFDIFVEMIGSLGSHDSNGNPKLEVPTAIFVKNGMVDSIHISTVPDHNAYEREMTDEEIEELRKIYAEAIRAIREG